MKKNKAKVKTDSNGQFFCTGCGKSGFRTIHHAYGHTGVCRGLEEITEALESSTPPSPPSPSPSSSSDGVAFSGEVKSAALAMTGAAPLGGLSENLLRVQISSLEDKIERLEKVATNHIPHLSGQMGSIASFFESPLFKWGLVAVAVIAVIYIVENGDSKTKQSMGNKLIDFAIKKI